MKEKEININNGKKIIIGVSILFCTIILIIGGSIAFFTQSAGDRLDDIVSTNKLALEYDDDNTYMREGLIPSSEEYAIRAYNQEGVNKCIDDKGYSICSVYQFTVTNTSDVSQELLIQMIPTANSFTNLYYMLFEVDNDQSKEIKPSKQLTYASTSPLDLANKITLTSNDSKTYEIVFYILNLPEEDQSSLDGNKTFGASIKVNSLTTGTYITKSFGEECWKVEEIIEGDNQGTFKLTEFYGINNDNASADYGKINEACSGYVSQDESDGFYSINVPSSVGGKEISTLGNNLFNSVVSWETSKINWQDTIVTNNYIKIKDVNIEEGIVVIEDGEYIYIEGENINKYEDKGTFYNIGYDASNYITVVDEVTIKLPASLINIGDLAFYSVPIKKIDLPTNLKTIGDSAFRMSSISSLEIPSSVQTIGDSAFDYNENLKELVFVDGNISNPLTIGNSAFYSCDLTYETEENSLILPARITSIGDYAFANEGGGNYGLTFIKYMGTSVLGNNWYTHNTTLITPNIP